MKILLFITGHSQLKEYDYFSIFLKKLQLNHICDIFIYCNNTNISTDIVKYYQQLTQENKQLFITSINSGYTRGGVEAVSNGIEMGIFKDYDYVIHLHPDVFITDDNYLLQVLEEYLEYDDICFLLTLSNPTDMQFFSFDFFIFKPKLLKNIFIDELYSFEGLPENYLHDMIMKHDIGHAIIKRFNNNNWNPRRIDDNLKLYHEHNLELVEKMINKIR